MNYFAYYFTKGELSKFFLVRFKIKKYKAWAKIRKFKI